MQTLNTAYRVQKTGLSCRSSASKIAQNEHGRKLNTHITFLWNRSAVRLEQLNGDVMICTIVSNAGASTDAFDLCGTVAPKIVPVPAGERLSSAIRYCNDSIAEITQPTCAKEPQEIRLSLSLFTLMIY